MFQLIVINLVISALVYVLTPKPKQAKPTAGKFEVPTPKLGQPIPVVFGECWIVDAHISYYGNQNTSSIKSKGGK